MIGLPAVVAERKNRAIPFWASAMARLAPASDACSSFDLLDRGIEVAFGGCLLAEHAGHLRDDRGVRSIGR